MLLKTNVKISSELIADGRENSFRLLDSTEVEIGCKAFKFQDFQNFL